MGDGVQHPRLQHVLGHVEAKDSPGGILLDVDVAVQINGTRPRPEGFHLLAVGNAADPGVCCNVVHVQHVTCSAPEAENVAPVLADNRGGVVRGVAAVLPVCCLDAVDPVSRQPCTRRARAGRCGGQCRPGVAADAVAVHRHRIVAQQVEVVVVALDAVHGCYVRGNRPGRTDRHHRAGPGSVAGNGANLSGTSSRDDANLHVRPLVQ